MSQSLFERIGGKATVDAAVDLFYRKVLSDASISDYFESGNMDDLRSKQKAFLTMAFGGPNGYSGRDLRSAHKPLVDKGLGDEQFDAVARHLSDTLAEIGVAPDLMDEVMAVTGSTRNDVLNR
jgi:hemoglobin